MAVLYSHKFRPSDGDVGEPDGGILGKLIYTTIAITGFVVSVRSQNIFFGPTTAGLTLHVSLAMAGARHIFMVKYWQRVKVWLCRTLSCEHCLHCDKAHDGVERRTK
ncbi:hypothetical protein [Pseudomonas sp. R3-52-08]|uniref:hypothetical protein n=1 Tax=Pseudomonas sp. R3-52-08 TaxID=1173284 RepID=UPI000F70FD88|nr:hypothetical protein [Pseudomonas sp. R3-52-08]AZF21700.1 hypothetical protein C4J91_2951 [Pseudomonas sp. R3-52-08]